jgi:outer membrane biosynthesis protein TonB
MKNDCVIFHSKGVRILVSFTISNKSVQKRGVTAMKKAWFAICILALILLAGCKTAQEAPETTPEVDAELTPPDSEESEQAEPTPEAPAAEEQSEEEKAEEPEAPQEAVAQEQPKEEAQIAPELTVPNTEII